MGIQQKEGLSRFVKELMASRQMTIHEVSNNAAAEITESYISGIIKGSSANPSVRKLLALASGLHVDPVELFKVAAGLSGSGEGVPRPFRAPDAPALVAIMRRIVSDDKLLEIMDEALLLEASDRLAALKILRTLNEARLGRTKTAGSS